MCEQTIDLRREVCPSILVKTRLALDSMLEGRTLRVELDYAPGVDSLMRLLPIHGDMVLGVTEAEGPGWVVEIRRGEPAGGHAEPGREV
jgi:TusA-related sulfurtransferase